MDLAAGTATQDASPLTSDRRPRLAQWLAILDKTDLDPSVWEPSRRSPARGRGLPRENSSGHSGDLAGRLLVRQARERRGAIRHQWRLMRKLHRRPRGPADGICRQMLAKTMGGELGARRKPHHRPEAVRRSWPHKIESRQRRFEIRRQGRRASDRADLRQQFGIQKRQPANIDLVARRGDHMLRHQFPDRTIGCRKS